MIFAAEKDSTIARISPDLATDEAGQRWFRDLGSDAQGCTLVVLDLIDGATPSVGDSLDIYDDGVAALVSVDAIPLWLVCDGVAHGPYYSLVEAYNTACALRPWPIDRARDTRMVHARGPAQALRELPWYPRCD